MKLAYIDFEFNRTCEAKLNLVSVAVQATENGVTVWSDSIWLHDEIHRKDAKEVLRKLFKVDGYTMVAYVAEAEARALFSLGVDIRWTPTIDLYIEYRLLLNHNHALAYGEQYINGEIKHTTPPPPKWERTEEDDNDLHHKPSYSLAAACFKLLGEKIDAVEKNQVRDIIIHGTPEEIEAARYRILKYNESDITLLPRLLKAIIATSYRTKFGIKPTKKDLEVWLRLATLRGQYSIHTAAMITRGYPVDMGKVRRFTQNVDKILIDAARECNAEMPPDMSKPFRWNNLREAYSINVKAITEWVTGQNLPYWRETDGKKPSISKDAFGDWFDSRSPGFPGAFCRYLKTKQSLNGFLPRAAGSTKPMFSDFVGSDDRCRPFMGIFGSQSSRSQPSATGFIPLKAHWMRNFIQPKSGMALAGVDYSSQEFLIAAILSQDPAMLAAYKSGDVYLAFGKAAGIIPQNGTKKTHSAEREGCKATVLGISYDMTSRGLAPRLSRALGRDVTEDEAESYIGKFYETYSDFAEWKIQIQKEYAEDGYLELPDGWTMFGDNDNRRSVGNFPVQGHGAVIMRHAVENAEISGCRVVYTLHDSLVIELPSGDFSKIATLKECMTSAFNEVMGTYGKTVPVRLEGEAWSPDYIDPPTVSIPSITFMPEYIDDKGRRDLARYRAYFDA